MFKKNDSGSVFESDSQTISKTSGQTDSKADTKNASKSKNEKASKSSSRAASGKNPQKKKGEKSVKKERWTLTFFFSGLFCLVFFVVLIIAYFIFDIFFHVDLLYEYNNTNLDTSLLLFIAILIIVVISYGIALGFGKLITLPIAKTINSMEKLAAGKYTERLSFANPFKTFGAFRDLSDSFNKLADELGHTETLSSDFINNFSHEFKTPIVSIAGFAKLLQKDDITREQKEEYLKIIEEESTRLSNLTKGVLDMVKIDNQTILTNITTFNLSEQIRKSILLLEDKWSKKNIDLQLDFDEYQISGNEELLHQVWINLLDNAIKYSPQGAAIIVKICRKGRKIVTSIENTGAVISSEDQKRIFNKFYQADRSHSSQGYGIGLAVVKKVVNLHKGTVGVISGNNRTIFTVALPE